MNASIPRPSSSALGEKLGFLALAQQTVLEK